MTLPFRTFATTTLAFAIAMLAFASRSPAQTVHVTDDTNINLASPTQLNGTATTLLVRNIGSGGERHTFLQFDLSTLPGGAPVTKATLRLWVSAVNDPGPMNVHAVLDPWAEETLSASVAPPIGGLISTLNITTSDQGKFVLVDVTSLVQGWADGSIVNAGLALVPSTSDPIRVSLDSKEATTTSHSPELEVAVVPAAIGDITGVAAGSGLTGGGTAGDVTLSLNTAFTDVRYAPALHVHDVSQISNAASLGPNVFTGTQTLDNANLDLDASTASAGNITKNGARFLHNVGTDNVFLGLDAGTSTTIGIANAGVGARALRDNTSGANNTAVGMNTLFHNTTGQGNTGIGASALPNSTTGDGNTALGHQAMLANSTGAVNTAIGSGTLMANTNGDRNVASGTSAMGSNTGGSNNTAVGFAALTRNTTGDRNTVSGYQALFNNVSGTSNTVVGADAMLNATGGNDNVAIGNNAGLNATTGSNNIYLGANAVGVAGQSNTMYLGGTQTTAIIAGVRGTSVTGGEVVMIDAAGRLGSGVVTPAANSIGSAEVIDDSLTATDLGANSVTSSELAADSITSDKVAFPYAASATEGGAAIDVACVGCVAASEVGFAFAGPGANTFTATQTIDTGNLDLDASTASAGNITKNGTRFLHNPGSNNTFLGLGAGHVATSGDRNTGVGQFSLENISTGLQNTATGAEALRLITTGSNNTAVGTGALYQSNGSSNTAVGDQALYLSSSGGANTAIGDGALFNTTTGSDNVAVGNSAGQNATFGSNNIYLGANVHGVAGESNTMYLGGTQTKTIIAGVRGTSVAGAEVVMIDAAGRLGSGVVTPAASSIGSAEVIDDALTAADLSANSVTSSELAADSITADKVAFNYAASVAEGGAALDVACAGCVSASEVGFTFAGLGANTFTATQTISSGNLDLSSGNLLKNGSLFLHTAGTNNTFVGQNAGNSSTTGFGKNSAFGQSALGSISSGDSNTAVGFLALASNTDGSVNTATGMQALRANTTGGGNVAAGSFAMNFNTTGDHNIAVGYFALSSNTNGSQNVALGGSALQSTTNGNNNTAVGFSALSNNTGSSNIGIGRQAGRDATGSNNIYLGTDLVGVPGESNTMYLGRVGIHTKTVVGGVRGITTVNADAIPVMIDSAGQLGTISSSRRFKEDIAGMADASERIFKLRPVTFRYAQAFGDGSKPLQFGLVAEEVADVLPELAARGADGEVETVHYERLNVLLLNELQKMRSDMQRQQQRIEALEQQLADALNRDQRDRR